ncbi:MAG: DUF6316 family protein [Halioglobus sp.]|nr:DUF6316 family protein [Halioglobus sp.]
MTDRARNRYESDSRTFFRSDRLQQDGGKWYFYTREGTMEGPFEDKVEALEALDKYITIMNLELIEPDSNLSLADND